MPGFGWGWGPFGFPFFSPWYAGYAPYFGFYGGVYRYPVRGAVGRPTLGQGVRPAAGARPLPPLAHQPAAGAAGFRSLPRSVGGGHLGMPAGGFHGGVIGGGFHGEGFHGGDFGGFHGGGFTGRR